MLHTIKGKIAQKRKNYLIVDTESFGFKVLTDKSTVKSSPKVGDEVKLFCFFYARETEFELYGFLNERSLKLFEMLNSVSGIGPKTALGVLGIDTPEKVVASIVEKKTEFLTRASGIGEKTADRVILELHSDLKLPKSGEIAERMDVDEDLKEALSSLGYSKRDAKKAVSKLGDKPKDLEGRLKEALKILS